MGILTRPLAARDVCEQWIPWAALAALGAVTIWTRLPGALRDPLWADEVYSARTIIAPSTHEALHRVAMESSPPGWFFLGRLLHQAGAAPDAMRLLSVAFSVALTILVFVYARRMLPLWGAVVAGTIAALGNQLVVHGREMRPYELMALLAVVLALVLEAAVAAPTRRRLGALAGTVLLGSMTHYFFLLPVFTGLVWLWTLAGAAGRRLRVSLAIGAGLVPLLLWLPVTLRQAGRVNQYFSGFRKRGVANLYSDLLASQAVWRRTDYNWRLVVVALVLAGAVVVARRPVGRLVALMAVLPVVLTAIVWFLGLNVFNMRNLIVVAPFVAIALAAVPSILPKPAALLASVAMIGAIGWIYSVQAQRERTPLDEVAQSVVQLGWTDNDPILFVGNSRNQRSALGWALPGHPQLGDATFNGRPCSRIFVVAESRAAPAWLQEHAGSVVAQRSFPFYGHGPYGLRQPYDVLVADLRWPTGFPAAGTPPGGTLFFYSRSGPVPSCLSPRPLHEPLSLF